MSGSSASAPRRRGVDIIDLDRYMRSAVKPPRDYREHFVVDAGGVDRAPRYSSASESSAPLPPRPRSPPPHSPPRHTQKRFSHDSGLSDGSYIRRRQKTHRRKPDVHTKQREQQIPPYSSPSVREFRVACEKALREQQEQITRVAQLCERLALPAQRAEPSELPDAKARPQSKTGQRRPHAQGVGDSSDTTEISSSSSSQIRRKDKRRSESCKTYKIIMSKLDELNRLFAARRATSPAPSPSPAPRRAASSRSVSMCDKLVATEELRQNGNRVVTPTVQTVLTPRDYHRSEYSASATGRSMTRGQRSVSSKERARSPFPHNYDLDNPVHFYEQAKRLQASRAGSRRARSAGGRSQPDTGYEEQFEQHGNIQHTQYSERAEYPQYAEHASYAKAGHAENSGHAKNSGHAESSSHSERAGVCAACRGYWRALWRHVPTLLRSRLF